MIISCGTMGGAYLVSTQGLGPMGYAEHIKWAVFAFGLVAFGFLGMGPVIIAVDSYGPVTDNAQSVYELSTIVGDTVGDPYKDTSSVAMNPVIKFTTLFGLLAVSIAEKSGGQLWTHLLAGLFFVVSAYFVYRSFYGMRIGNATTDREVFGGKGLPEEELVQH